MKRQKKILIVDDEKAIRNLFKRQLNDSGYCSIEAEDGEKALSLLRKHKDIDLIILDILLPNSNGLDIFEILKKGFPNIKILISSVYSKDEQEFLIWDADDYYYKCDAPSVFISKINNLLKFR